jgi:hypothetical protein
VTPYCSFRSADKQRCFVFYLIVFWFIFLLPFSIYGEEKTPWEFAVEGNLYSLPDLTYLNPVLSADKGFLHLEGRYNYEDLETGSIFAGVNFHTGESLELNVTPIIGGVFGNSNGVAPGFLLEINFGRFSVSSEGEYFFSSDDKDFNFFYSWSEVLYSPADWIWFGIAGQRTRAYETDLEIQRGLVVGVAKGNLSVSGYLMNIGWGDPFGVVSLGYAFN